MLYFLIVVLFVSLFTFIYGVMNVINKDKMCIENRMKQIEDINSIYQDNMENKSFGERALIPFYTGIGTLILKTTPGHKIVLLKKKLDKAGLLKSSTPEKWIYIKGMIMIIFSVFFGLLSYVIQPNILKAVSISMVIMLLIYTCFNFYLSSKIEKRKRLILKDLPYTLDLITVSVEAGLSFDGAISRVIGNIDGELCDEFGKTLKEIRMGIERKLALRNMSERCDVKELSMIITSLIQADELGVGLGKVLRIESSQLREHRKQIAREKAMKAPIKMLFPLIFFIFPSIFIIILGPAIIKIFNIFLK